MLLFGGVRRCFEISELENSYHLLYICVNDSCDIPMPPQALPMHISGGYPAA